MISNLKKSQSCMSFFSVSGVSTLNLLFIRLLNCTSTAFHHLSSSSIHVCAANPPYLHRHSMRQGSLDGGGAQWHVLLTWYAQFKYLTNSARPTAYAEQSCHLEPVKKFQWGVIVMVKALWLRHGCTVRSGVDTCKVHCCYAKPWREVGDECKKRIAARESRRSVEGE